MALEAALTSMTTSNSLFKQGMITVDLEREQITVMEKILKSVQRLNQTFSDFIDQQEMLRLKGLDKPDVGGLAPTSTPSTPEEESMYSKLLKIGTLFLTAFRLGIMGVVGYFIAQFEIVKALFGKSFASIGKSITTAFTDLTKGITERINNTRKVLSNSIKGFRMGLAMQVELIKSSLFEIFDGMRNKIKNSFLKFTDKFARFFDIISDAGKAFQELTSGKVTAAISKFTTPIKTFFTDLPGKMLSTLMKPFQMIKTFVTGIGAKFAALAGMFGKIFLPFAVIMTVWDTAKGALEGLEENGIIGGFMGAIEGLLNSIIFAPLDLIKSLVSWILEKFGFDEASAGLDSFSFQEIFSGIMNTVTKFFVDMKNSFIDIINKAIGYLNLLPFVDIEPFEAGEAYVAPAPKPKAVIKTESMEDETAVATDRNLSGQNVVVSAPTSNTTNNVSSSSTAFAFNQNENPEDLYGRTLTRRGYR